MASFSLRRGDLNVHDVNEDQFGLRWHRLLFPVSGAAPLHLGVVDDPAAAPAPQNHSEPTLTAPLDAESTQAPTPNGDAAAGAGAADDTAAAPIPDEANPFVGLWHPPFLLETPLVDSPPSVPAEAAPPGGFIPKSEAVIWSGPAIMAIPADMHAADTGATGPANSASADAGSAGATAGHGTDGGTADAGNHGGTAADPGTSDAGGTADTPPDEANIGLVLTRDDLDPVLTAMGGGSGHAAGDLSGAFLPAGDGHPSELPLDLLGIVTLPPMPPPPPPEVI